MVSVLRAVCRGAVPRGPSRPAPERAGPRSLRAFAGSWRLLHSRSSVACVGARGRLAEVPRAQLRCCLERAAVIGILGRRSRSLSQCPARAPCASCSLFWRARVRRTSSSQAPSRSGRGAGGRCASGPFLDRTQRRGGKVCAPSGPRRQRRAGCLQRDCTATLWANRTSKWIFAPRAATARAPGVAAAGAQRAALCRRVRAGRGGVAGLDCEGGLVGASAAPSPRSMLAPLAQLEDAKRASAEEEFAAEKQQLLNVEKMRIR